MRPGLICAALATLIAATTFMPAVAEERRDEGRGRHGRDEWHDRDIARFHEHDFERWRRGRWQHGWHEGRNGWWWVVGGTWYYYPAPIYPYPDPYQPPVIAGAPPPP